MSGIDNDRRTKRTKTMIRNALAELIEEKGYNNISITDLTNRANINRGTFYLHYADKFDLLEKIENEVIDELIKSTKDMVYIDLISRDSINKPIPFIVQIFEYIKNNALFMNAILGPNGNPNFYTKIKKIIEANLIENENFREYNKEKMLVPQEYFISYVLSAHLGVVQQWVKNGMEEPPEEMALILSKLFLLGPLRVVGFNIKL